MAPAYTHHAFGDERAHHFADYRAAHSQLAADLILVREHRIRGEAPGHEPSRDPVDGVLMACGRCSRVIHYTYDVRMDKTFDRGTQSNRSGVERPFKRAVRRLQQTQMEE